MAGPRFSPTKPPLRSSLPSPPVEPSSPLPPPSPLLLMAERPAALSPGIALDEWYETTAEAPPRRTAHDDDDIFSEEGDSPERKPARAGQWGIERSNTVGSLAEYVLDKDKREEKGLRTDVDFVRQLARSVAAAAPADELDAVKFTPSDRITAWLAGMGTLLTCLTEMQLEKSTSDASLARSRLSFRTSRRTMRPPTEQSSSGIEIAHAGSRSSGTQRASSVSVQSADRLSRASGPIRRSSVSSNGSRLNQRSSVSSVGTPPRRRSSISTIASLATPPKKVRATFGLGLRHASGRLGASHTPQFVMACAETLVHESISSLNGHASEDVAPAMAPFTSREPSWWDTLQLWLVTSKEERDFLQAVAAADRREQRESQLRKSSEARRRSQIRSSAASLASAGSRASSPSSRGSSVWQSAGSEPRRSSARNSVVSEPRRSPARHSVATDPRHSSARLSVASEQRRSSARHSVATEHRRSSARHSAAFDCHTPLTSSPTLARASRASARRTTATGTCSSSSDAGHPPALAARPAPLPAPWNCSASSSQESSSPMGAQRVAGTPVSTDVSRSTTSAPLSHPRSHAVMRSECSSPTHRCSADTDRTSTRRSATVSMSCVDGVKVVSI